MALLNATYLQRQPIHLAHALHTFHIVGSRRSCGDAVRGRTVGKHRKPSRINVHGDVNPVPFGTADELRREVSGAAQ
jgi:hypothetical protein